MKIFIWIMALVVLVPWTGAVWLSYALVDVSGDWMSANAVDVSWVISRISRAKAS